MAENYISTDSIVETNMIGQTNYMGSTELKESVEDQVSQSNTEAVYSKSNSEANKASVESFDIESMLDILDSIHQEKANSDEAFNGDVEIYKAFGEFLVSEVDALDSDYSRMCRGEGNIKLQRYLNYVCWTIKQYVELYKRLFTDNTSFYCIDGVELDRLSDYPWQLANSELIQHEYPDMVNEISDFISNWEIAEEGFPNHCGFNEKGLPDIPKVADDEANGEVRTYQESNPFVYDDWEDPMDVVDRFSRIIDVNELEFYPDFKGYKTIWSINGYSARVDSDRRIMQGLLVAICRTFQKNSYHFESYCEFNRGRNDKGNHSANVRREEDLEMLRAFEDMELL